MEEKFGLIKGVECKFVKTDPELIETLSKKLELSIDRTKEIMRYNMFTVNQFAQLTGLAVSSITNKARPSINNENGSLGTELDYCLPFSDKYNEGPKFIIRNEKAEKLLKA